MILSQRQLEEIAASTTKDFNRFFFGDEADKPDRSALPTPIDVTGVFKLTGLKRRPKGICTDRIVGTRKGSGLPSSGSKQTNHISCCTTAEKQRSNL